MGPRRSRRRCCSTVPADIKNIEILKGGEISQAFSFDDKTASFVIKVRKVRRRFRKKDPFGKEIIISKIVEKNNIQIPIPKVIQHGIFKEIKKDLQKKGYRFNSETDTEVIIYGYKEYGIDVI